MTREPIEERRRKGLRFEFAPMEGITDDIFRRLHRKYFPGADRYYTPFLSPTDRKIFSPKELREVIPENNRDVPLIPQLLTASPKQFLAGAKLLRDLGYGEVNLNLGCPSGTVTAKGRGAGLLYPERRDELRALLDGVFGDCPVAVSIKTRLGKENPEEFEALLELFRQYPIHVLTVHPRVREDQYRHPVRMEWFWRAMEDSPFPLGLSGAVTVAADLPRRLSGHPAPDALMLGRGLVADPALIMKLRGQPAPDRAVYRAFVTELFEATAERLGSPRNTMFRMKELWSYFIWLFDDRDRYLKMLRKAVSLSEYQAAVARIFGELPLRDEAQVPWIT